MIGDGQCTYGSIVIKSSSKKVRTLSEGRVLAGMAGAVSDAFVLIDLLEQKLEEYPGQLMRACVEMNKLWRTDKMLRRLEASLLVADKEVILEVSGDGNVIAPDFGVASIGSGSVAALCKFLSTI